MLNVSNVVLDIKNRQIDSGEKRNEQHTELVSKLAVIARNQDSFAEYQEKCDEDRAMLGKEIREVKQTQQVHKRVASIFGALITGAVGVLEFIRHI